MIPPPSNVGTPTKPKPHKCSACNTPIFRWNGEHWVCWNCKLHTHIYSHTETVDITTLDGCSASGVYRNQRVEPVVEYNSLPETTTVYHIGYSKHGTEQSLESIMSNENVHLIDTRHKAYSRIPWATGDALNAKYGRRYHNAGKYLGNTNHADKGGPIQIANLELGIKGLCRYIDEQKTLVLLCGCKEYEACHRRVIVEELVRIKPDVSIVGI